MVTHEANESELTKSRSRYRPVLIHTFLNPSLPLPNGTSRAAIYKSINLQSVVDVCCGEIRLLPCCIRILQESYFRLEGPLTLPQLTPQGTPILCVESPTRGSKERPTDI